MSRGKVRTAAEVCADCGSPDPTWASVNRGVLICDECCNVHRSLGRHISQIKSLKKGQWSSSQLAMVHQLANNGANNIWEHSLLDPSQNKHGKRKPNPRDQVHPVKADYIRAKYQFLSFVNKNKDCDVSSVEDLSKQLHSSVRTNNLETCLRLLSKGADPNYFYPEKNNCPLHVAAQAGQGAQVELLAVYGADPGALDGNGKMPIDYARTEGHIDLASRLVECQYELTDKLAYFVCSRKPDHRSQQHFIIPELADSSLDMSELAKQAKKMLQALPNNLFEELAVDVYDEVDRRENDEIWLSTNDQSSLVGDRQTIPFLPVNPEFSTTRNQGRQKLARFNPREFATLIIDILSDAKRRQTGITSPVQTPKEPSRSSVLTGPQRISKGCSQISSDDEPLYDSVASDEDYSSIDTQSIKSVKEELKKDRPADSRIVARETTPTSMVSFTESMTSEQVEGPVSTEEFLEVKKTLALSEAKVQQLLQTNRDLRLEINQLQTMVKRLIEENSSLKKEQLQVDSTALFNGLPPDNEVFEAPSAGDGVPLRATRMVIRPQSMFEPRDQQRESEKKDQAKKELTPALSVSNIHIGNKEAKTDFHSKTREKKSTSSESDLNTTSLQCNVKNTQRSDQRKNSLQTIGEAAGGTGDPFEELGTDSKKLPSQEEVVKKTEKITKKIQELLQSAQESKYESFGPCSEKIHAAVVDMAAIFPKRLKSETIKCALQLLTSSAARLCKECKECQKTLDKRLSYDPRLKTQQVIQSAYDIAKAAKQLVTKFQ